MPPRRDPTSTPREPDPPIVLVVRRTLDWGDPDAVRAHLLPEFRRKAATWDATFRTPYAAFRHRLTEIARDNWARIAGVRVVPRDAVPAGALVAPVDDDDWFAPHLATALRAALAPGVLGYHWPVLALEPPRERRVLGLLRPRRVRMALDPVPRFTCETNGYAVLDAQGWLEWLAPHSAASRQFDAHPERVRHVPQPLGVQNKSLASMSVLDWGAPDVDPAWLRRRYERYRRFYRRVILPPALAWARPHVEAMDRLLRDLTLA